MKKQKTLLTVSLFLIFFLSACEYDSLSSDYENDRRTETSVGSF